MPAILDKGAESNEIRISWTGLVFVPSGPVRWVFLHWRLVGALRGRALGRAVHREPGSGDSHCVVRSLHCGPGAEWRGCSFWARDLVVGAGWCAAVTKEEQSIWAWGIVLLLLCVWRLGVYIRAERRRERAKLDIKPAFREGKRG